LSSPGKRNRDLSVIQDFIAVDSPRRALSFTNELIAECRALESMSLAFQLVPNREKSGIRRRACGRYLIFYRIRADDIEIIRILSGARDYDVMLPDENE
jgi:plasmid stabilization system protein ParE